MSDTVSNPLNSSSSAPVLLELQPAAQDVCLVYASAATRSMERKDLASILEAAARHNAPAGITGMLLYTEGAFFQVLEGDPGRVHALYDTILKDTRHASAIKLIEEAIDKRSFSRWSMGFAQLTRAEIAKIDGLNDFLRSGIVTSRGGARKSQNASFRLPRR